MKNTIDDFLNMTGEDILPEIMENQKLLIGTWSNRKEGELDFGKEAQVSVTGPVRAVIHASSSAKNTDFTAKLVDFYPDGRAIRISEGMVRAGHRNPNELPTNIEPDKIYEYHVDLWTTSNLFKKGHRICVEISSSCFPRFDRNLNTVNNFATDASGINAE